MEIWRKNPSRTENQQKQSLTNKTTLTTSTFASTQCTCMEYTRQHPRTTAVGTDSARRFFLHETTEKRPGWIFFFLVRMRWGRSGTSWCLGYSSLSYAHANHQTQTALFAREQRNRCFRIRFWVWRWRVVCRNHWGMEKTQHDEVSVWWCQGEGRREMYESDSWKLSLEEKVPAVVWL